MSKKDDAVQVVTGPNGEEIDLVPGTVVIYSSGEAFCVQEGDVGVVPVDGNNHPKDGITVVKPEPQTFRDENGNTFTALVFGDKDGNLRQVVKDPSGQWYTVVNPETEMLYADGRTAEVGDKMIRVNDDNIPIDAQGKVIAMFDPVENADGERIDDLAQALKKDSMEHFGVIKAKQARHKLYEKLTGEKAETAPKVTAKDTERDTIPAARNIPQAER